jgi:hypothetical protein
LVCLFHTVLAKTKLFITHRLINVNIRQKPSLQKLVQIFFISLFVTTISTTSKMRLRKKNWPNRDQLISEP